MRRWAILVLIFRLALREGVNVRAGSEAPIRIPRTMFGLRLHGTFLPELALGRRERLPYNSCRESRLEG
jgi:hypothetical protein